MKCKNCKVELSKDLDKCPLCNNKVNNPLSNKVYNTHIEELSSKLNMLYFTKTIIKILILTNIICIICNLAINKHLNWSIYVIFSSIYLSSFSLFIILKNKKIAFLLNILFLELLLFMIAYLTNTINWFLYLVGPFILLITGFIFLNIYLSNYKNILRNMSCLLIYIALSLYIINGCIKLYKIKSLLLTWSLIASLPILLISIILMLLSFNKTISNEIEKRFFI